MNNWKSLLREHIEHHPELEAQDVLKFIHQSFMGPGHLIADPQAALANFVSRQPMGRLGTSDEVAKAIVFAAGQGVGFMTGANIVVDGGMTI